MRDIYELLPDAEPGLEEFLQWQIQHQPTADFRAYARATGTAEELFRAAAVLYPRFVEVEGAVVLAEQYEPDNWRTWRDELQDPFRAAAMVNHVHLDGLLWGDFAGYRRLEHPLGELVAFFWQLAVDRQFPEAGVEVTYDGDVVSVTQPGRLGAPAS